MFFVCSVTVGAASQTMSIWQSWLEVIGS